MTDSPDPGRANLTPREAGRHALKHGAYSADIRPIAEALVDELTEVAPWASRPVFMAEVQARAWAEAKVQVYRRFMEEHGPLDDEKEPRYFLLRCIGRRRRRRSAGPAWG